VNSAELKRAKREVRREVLAARDALEPSERAARSKMITDRLLALPELEAGGPVMTFWSFGSEVDTMAMIERLAARGITVALPRIQHPDMEPRTWRPGEPLTETSFGAREPAGGRVLRPGELDVVVVPAVAFDRAGHRVGYGGGFYDRFLPATRPDAFRVGVGFSLQLMDHDLPQGSFDLGVDAVVTERETMRRVPGGDARP